MQVQVSGKSVDVGDSLRTHITNRLGQIVAKYFDGTADGHVTVTREGGEFRTESVVHLSSGIVLQAGGKAADAYASFEQAAERMEKRLRRYKRRLKDYHARSARLPAFDASSYVIASVDDEAPEPDENSGPAIIAETTTKIQQLSVSEAVMQLDVSDATFLFFKNVSHGGLNVVYRRDDGNFGWIDPGRAVD